jgi:5'-3' exonuclease
MIRGDASDGLPGIKGIGEKGAAEIANSFDNMDEVIAAAKSGEELLKESHRKKILADIKYAEIASKLTSCADDVLLPKVDFKISIKPKSEKSAMQIVKDYGLATSIERLKAALVWG